MSIKYRHLAATQEEGERCEIKEHFSFTPLSVAEALCVYISFFLMRAHLALSKSMLIVPPLGSSLCL